MRTNPLVSIIIPVYNVEKFFKQCVESAINQSYRNIEIILVDDGSTDSCGAVCDFFVNKDSRIKVIHQKNMGLSAARNTGLSYATGDLISFLDSDDYMNPFMVEKMIAMIEKYDADICCCDYTSDFFTKQIVDGLVEEYDNNLACASLLDTRGFKCYAWNKIYKKKLFNNIEFPVGKCFEDIVTIYKLFQQASKIIYLREELYFYRRRNNSITRCSFSNKNYDLLFAINEILELSLTLDDAYCRRLSMGYMQYYLTFLKSAYIAHFNANIETLKLRKFIISHLICFRENNVTFFTKIQLLLLLISPRLLKTLYLKKDE